MSKLDELIQELCPDGVEYKKLGDLIKIEKGKQLNKTHLFDKYEENLHPVINGGISPSGFWNEYNYSENLITISQGGASAGYVNYIKTKFWAGAHCYVVSSVDNDIIYRYVYHFLKSKEIELKKSQVGAGIPSVSLHDINYLSLPVPPLEVQCEIVRILDNFLKNTTELLMKLNDELTKRQKQHDYYLDQLFMVNDNPDKVKLIEVLLSLKTGLNPRKFFQLNTPDADGYYVTVRELGNRNVRYWESKDRVNQIGLNRINERSNLEINDVLFSGTGTIGRVSIIEEEPENWNVKEGVYILKTNSKLINPVYLMYLMRSNYMKNIYLKYIVGSPVASVPMKDLKNVEFYLPSIDQQEKIVNELDKLEETFNDLSLNLSNDIEKTQKQYEYYRDKLLNFKEVDGNE